MSSCHLQCFGIKCKELYGLKRNMCRITLMLIAKVGINLEFVENSSTKYNTNLSYLIKFQSINQSTTIWIVVASLNSLNWGLQRNQWGIT